MSLRPAALSALTNVYVGIHPVGRFAAHEIGEIDCTRQAAHLLEVTGADAHHRQREVVFERKRPDFLGR